MKIFQRYLIKEHIGPFVGGLSVIMFILLMQFLIKYLNHIFGKGLSFFTIIEMIVLNLAWMLALAVPMATLIAVLMAFGRLSADNEITILKSSGVSIFKIMRPSLIFGLILTLFMLFFNDYILPDVNHRAASILRSIKRKKPTLSLQENIFFTDFANFSFVVKKIEPPTPEEWEHKKKMLGPAYQQTIQVDRLKDVTIFDNSKHNIRTTINATEGYMVYSTEKKALIFTLFNGEYHEVNFKKAQEYQRSSFERYLVYIPATNFELERTNRKSRNDREMNIEAMQKVVASQNESYNKQLQKVERDVDKNFSQLYKLFEIIKYDSLNALQKFEHVPIVSGEHYTAVLFKTKRMADRYAQKMNTNINIMDNHLATINQYGVEIHKKIALPFASLIFVLLGAPLGIMARKGSMGVAISLSLGFFVLYWAFLIGGEKLADRQILNPMIAMWAANILLLFVGIYLTWRAIKESPVIQWEKLKNIFKRKAA